MVAGWLNGDEHCSLPSPLAAAGGHVESGRAALLSARVVPVLALSQMIWMPTAFLSDARRMIRVQAPLVIAPPGNGNCKHFDK